MILTVGGPAAGGACVARAEDGRVVFVRHALPGERVRVEVTSSTSSFLRADAVEVLSASPDRVEPPCPFSGPGRCGGCDWQHVELPAQRDMKAALVAEQLDRLAGVTWAGAVQEVLPSLGWRTRVTWAVTAAGDVGLHRHRSHELELVDSCLIAAPGASAPLGLSWPGAKSIEAFAVDGQSVLSVVGKQVTLPVLEASGLVVDGRPVQQPHGVRTTVLGRSFEVAAGGFWQVHPAAATVLSEAVLELLAPATGESVADLYAGVGLFASLLGQAVGPTGAVLAVEADSRACADAARNTADQPWVSVRTASVEVGLVRGLAARRPAVIVLDPPRTGAGLEVSAALAQLRPRALAYVSCDAASFARDLRVFTDAGWSLGELRAYDLFPMTEHVELVGLLLPP